MAKNPHSYPWDVLGIEGTRNLADIKRAYAVKLKAKRPEEDAEAFQALVEARDLALALASQGLINTTAPKEDLVDPGADAGVGELTTDGEVPVHHETPSEAFHESRRSADKNEQPYSGDLVPETYSLIVTQVDEFLATREEHPDATMAREALAKLADLSIPERQEIEPILLKCLSKHIQKLLYEANYMNKGASRSRAKLWLVNQLDSTFDWSENDRRVQELMWFENAQFTDQLQLLLGKERPQPPNFQAQPASTPFWQTRLGWSLIAIALLQLLRLIFHGW